MAKKVYEEEKIRAIADQIKKLVPSLEWSEFNTGEMPNAIKQVYEAGRKSGNTEGYLSGKIYGENEGKAKGRREGYQDGYNRGREYGYYQGFEEGSKNNSGVELPELTNPGTAEDMLAGKQLIDAEGNVVTGTIVTRTRDDLTLSSASTVAVPPGYYAETAEKTINVEPFINEGYDEGYKDGWGVGYDEGYDIGTNDGYDMGYDDGHKAGLTDGAENLKTEEARTEDNVTYSVNNASVTVTVESGYYAANTEKVIEGDDLEPITDRAYDQGLADGETYVKTTEAKTSADLTASGATITVPSGYYADGAEYTIDTDPFYDSGYDDGYSDGLADGGGGGGGSDVDEMMLLDEYHDWEGEPPFYSCYKYLSFFYSSLSSSPVIVSAQSWHESKYMHLYVYAETESLGELYLTLVLPPANEENDWYSFNSLEVPDTCYDLKLWGIRWSDDGV